MSRTNYIKSFIVLTALVMAGLLGFAAASYAEQPIPIFINGEELKIAPEDGQPIAINNRTMVPLRAISEALGVKVDWDDVNKRVLITAGGVAPENPVMDANASDVARPITIFVNGAELKIALEDGQPIAINNRTMVPLRAISEALGVKVDWDSINKKVIIIADKPNQDDNGTSTTNKPNEDDNGTITTNKPNEDDNGTIDTNISILGQSVATSAQLKALLAANNPNAPDLVDLYLNIGQEYGIRGDIAFCQAAKETGWWNFGNLVKPEQHNYCGLGATGRINTGEENLNQADSARVKFLPGFYGASYDNEADGIEAQIQHLYAYACTNPLPAGKVLLDPRFNLVNRGIASNWVALGGKWAVPGFDRNKYGTFEEAFADGKTYGQSILTDYYAKAFE